MSICLKDLYILIKVHMRVAFSKGLKGTAHSYLFISNPGDDIFLLKETAMQIRV